MLNFELHTESEGRSALVRVRGDFDLQVAEQIADSVIEAESTEPDLLVFDLSEVSFMDSTGMGVVVAAHLRAIDASRQLVIVMPPTNVRRAFEIAGLDKVITSVEDLASVYPP